MNLPVQHLDSGCFASETLSTLKTYFGDNPLYVFNVGNVSESEAVTIHVLNGKIRPIQVHYSLCEESKENHEASSGAGLKSG